MLCFVYVSQHNTKELEREENILVLNTTCAILKMSSNLKEPSIIVALKSLIENLLCNIVGLVLLFVGVFLSKLMTLTTSRNIAL